MRSEREAGDELAAASGNAVQISLNRGRAIYDLQTTAAGSSRRCNKVPEVDEGGWRGGPNAIVVEAQRVEV